MTTVDLSILASLEPMSSLSPSRLKELAGLCFVERVSKDIDPFRMNIVKSSQALYLIHGDLGIKYEDGSKKIIRGGTEGAKHSIDSSKLEVKQALAITDIEIIRIDIDLLDIMMTWDQLAEYETSTPASKHTKPISGDKARGTGDLMTDTSIFSVGKLQSGAFSRLPPANIEEMFKRMVPMNVKAGQVIINQGAEGDYYYIIDKGTAIVSRVASAGQPPTVLAELHGTDAFGEEALVSDNKRNATITMKTDGRLLRLNKTDFIELLKAPLIHQVNMQSAKDMVSQGAVWLDVRFPSEYSFDHLNGAINAPLNEIRSVIHQLDKNKRYVAYCQTGRRSSAAAFIMVQNGLNVLVLEGGTRQKV